MRHEACVAPARFLGALWGRPYWGFQNQWLTAKVCALCPGGVTRVADDEVIPPKLTDDEVRILKEIVRGHQATRWVAARLKIVATWFAAIVGAWLLAEGQLAKYLQRLLGGDQ